MSMDIVQLEKQAEKALNYLAESDYEHAELKAKQNLLSELRKAVVAEGFESIEKGTAESRRQAAHNTPEYREHIQTMYDNDLAYFNINNKRQRAVATIELFRTMSANQRRG